MARLSGFQLSLGFVWDGIIIIIFFLPSCQLLHSYPEFLVAFIGSFGSNKPLPGMEVIAFFVKNKM